MKSIALVFVSFVFLTSCQTSKPEQKDKKTLTDPVSASRDSESNAGAPPDVKDSTPSRKAMSDPVRPSKQKTLESIKPKAPSFPPNTISNCPAGLNGSLVGQIEQGRYCFTNVAEGSSRCLDRNDEPVRRQAESYCHKLKGHWTRTGVWKYGPDLDLKIDQLKRSSCQCGLWRGQALCKSFFKFKCQTVRL